MRILLKKQKFIITYLVFGVLTTFLNWGTYYLCYTILRVANVPAVCIAWFVAVAFAFVTNKIWVFSSKSFDRKTLSRELTIFMAARLATGILDVAIMYLAVDFLGWNASIWKLISNVIVIILNYVVSKLVIFKT